MGLETALFVHDPPRLRGAQLPRPLGTERLHSLLQFVEGSWCHSCLSRAMRSQAGGKFAQLLCVHRSKLMRQAMCTMVPQRLASLTPPHATRIVACATFDSVRSIRREESIVPLSEKNLDHSVIRGIVTGLSNRVGPCVRHPADFSV